MAQTGTIYGYHDGATYSLANVYDSQTSELELSALANPNTECETVKTVWFDSDGIKYEGSGVPKLMSSSTTSISDVSPYITTENTAFGGYGLRLDNARFFHTATTASNSRYKTKRVSSVNYYMPVHTMEFWIYVDTSAAESDTMIVFTYGVDYTASGHSIGGSPLRCKYTADSVEFFWGSSKPTDTKYHWTSDLDRSILNNPLHIGFIFGYEEMSRMYINGELYYYYENVPTMTYTSYSTYWHCFGASTTYLGSGTGKYKVTNSKFAGVISEYRYTIGARYHDNFTPQSFKPKTIPVNANMLIRHNDANHYIPLTTNVANTSAPYIAVRHGSTNYFTLK